MGRYKLDGRRLDDHMQQSWENEELGGGRTHAACVDCHECLDIPCVYSSGFGPSAEKGVYSVCYSPSHSVFEDLLEGMIGRSESTPEHDRLLDFMEMREGGYWVFPSKA